MNVIRDGAILAAYTFAVILVFIFLSDPLATIVSMVIDAHETGFTQSIETEVYAVFGICCAIAILIPTVIFIWLAFSSRNEEVYY